MKQRTFLDTVTLSVMDTPINAMQKLIDQGHQLVVPNTVVDVKAFQEHAEWLQEKLEEGSVVIQMWMDADSMTAKNFFWSSCQEETPAAGFFEEAIQNLPNRDGILKVKALMDKFGLERQQWNPGTWSAPEPLSKEHQEVLEVPTDATRSDVLAACKVKARMDIFDAYNVGYNRGLAQQHHCTHMLVSDGTAKEL